MSKERSSRSSTSHSGRRTAKRYYKRKREPVHLETTINKVLAPFGNYM